jgi:Zn-finger nucleic acid-binding protein
MSPGPYRGGLTIDGSPGPCPRCPDVPLEPRTAGSVAVAHCRSCRGVWIGGAGYLDIFFAADEDLIRLARADAASPSRPVATRADADADAGAGAGAGADAGGAGADGAGGAASCPACGSVLEAQSGGTGITVDVCARHGFWLDAGELGALFGGLTVTEESPGLFDRLARWLLRDER